MLVLCFEAEQRLFKFFQIHKKWFKNPTTELQFMAELTLFKGNDRRGGENFFLIQKQFVEFLSDPPLNIRLQDKWDKVMKKLLCDSQIETLTNTILKTMVLSLRSFRLPRILRETAELSGICSVGI